MTFSIFDSDRIPNDAKTYRFLKAGGKYRNQFQKRADIVFSSGFCTNSLIPNRQRHKGSAG